MVLHKYSLAAAHIITAKHWHHLDENSLHLTVSETGWAKCAWGKMYGQFICGATTFVYDFDRFIPANVLKIIQDYKLTSFCAPPTMYRFFIKEGIENYDLSSLKYSCIAGEALNLRYSTDGMNIQVSSLWKASDRLRALCSSATFTEWSQSRVQWASQHRFTTSV